MANIHVQNNEINEYRTRMRSMSPLYQASKDINDWTFTEYPPPNGSPPSAYALFEAKCRKTSITRTWLIDQADLKDGSPQMLYKRIVTEFTQSLLQLADLINAYKYAQLQQRGFQMPSKSGLALSAHMMLQKGDHDH